ncbi:NEDD8 activating enzyme [Malassezia pachydermatis]|uniref:NEDD8-activating enzyme E1 regulatory subunit n=1 Tax=Malassezia pachydermatis TaxID=77020 RepID=A0A0M8MKB8_9BASI|nr:auxin-resistance protein [Malassezia pachydermatis]KOS13288.1 auxin-resistance protein [Malassezia pachydermatis]
MASQPDRHTQRYDRQLRVWNKAGQEALEHAHVLVVGASALTSHILKNLVLPGLGTCTIWDDAVVTPDDAHSNFFLEPSSIGKPYASELARLLGELNPATRMLSCIEAPTSLLSRDKSFLASLSLLVCVRQPRAMAENLADIAWNVSPSIPVLATWTSGFQGLVCVSLGELGIVETHPESLMDLRLTRPFPALEAYASDYTADTHDTLAQSHIPYVVLLLQALAAWKKDHAGAYPTSSERRAFISHVEAFRTPGADTENVDEALAALAQHVWRPIQSSAVPADVTALMDDWRCRQLSPTTSPFWLLVAALQAFVAQEGVLPLPGTLPDMKATSSDYVSLQAVYATKAREDVALFESLLDHVLTRAQTTREEAGLDAHTVKTFVKHAAVLQLIRGRRLRLQRTEPNIGALTAAFADPVNPVTAQYYVAFLAADDFYMAMQRYPGQAPGTVETDAATLLSYAKTYASRLDLALSDADWDRVQVATQEIARGAWSDTPSTAALVGGLVAQEVIKILTVQYLPLDNTCVYDGVSAALGSFRL